VWTTHDPRLVGSRLQIHESKYESIARFRIQAPCKRGIRITVIVAYKYNLESLFALVVAR
jgi:hypothetical protein